MNVLYVYTLEGMHVLQLLCPEAIVNATLLDRWV